MENFGNNFQVGRGGMRQFAPSQTAPQQSLAATATSNEEEELRRRIQEQQASAQNLSQYADPRRLQSLQYGAAASLQKAGITRPFTPPFMQPGATFRPAGYSSVNDRFRRNEQAIQQRRYEDAYKKYLQQMTGLGSISEIQSAAPLAVQRAQEEANRLYGQFYENYLRQGGQSEQDRRMQAANVGVSPSDIGTFYG